MANIKNVDNVTNKVSKSITKNGKIKGRNKKETKTLKALCTHHRRNKHGKLKAMIFSPDGENCVCPACKGKFPASFYSNDDIKDTITPIEELNQQNKYTAVAINAGNETINFFCQFEVMLKHYPKMAKKVRNVAEKQGQVKDKKNKNRGKGSSMYGSWSSR